MKWHKTYGSTEGPLGIPMQDRQAFQLEAIIKQLPKEDQTLKHLVTNKAPAELLEGERSDVSWISTEEIDRDKEIVVAKGMNDASFKLNPVVTLQHCYYMPPVGRSLWRKKTKDGPLSGIKAKTHYPPRPEDWPENQDWGPDTTFSLIKAKMLNGKSIGFITLKKHTPTQQEINANPELAQVHNIIDEWLLLEYACCYLPCNQSAIVEAVSKSTIALPKEIQDLFKLDIQPTPPLVVPFMTMEEVEREVHQQLKSIQWQPIMQRAVNDAIDVARGRV